MYVLGSLTNVELFGSRYTEGEVVYVFPLGVNHQPPCELGRCEPEWIVWFLVQLEFSMDSANIQNSPGEPSFISLTLQASNHISQHTYDNCPAPLTNLCTYPTSRLLCKHTQIKHQWSNT